MLRSTAYCSRTSALATQASFLALFLALVSPVALAAAQPSADSLYAHAVRRLPSASVKESIAAFERVLDADAKYARAYNELAKLHLRLDTPDARKRAEQLVKRAMQLDRGNLAFEFTLGDVLWAQGYLSNARRHYEHVFGPIPRPPTPRTV